MKKELGFLLGGVILGYIGYGRLLARGITDGINRGPVIYEDDNIIVKQGQYFNGKLSNLAWVKSKNPEK